MHTDWKERLSDWAPEPPASVWERLSESLDQETSPVLVRKLQQYNPPPPPAAWQSIEAALDAEKTPVISIKPVKPWVRYAGIAATVLAVFVGFRNYNNTGDTKPAVNLNSAIPKAKAGIPATLTDDAPIAVTASTTTEKTNPQSSFKFSRLHKIIKGGPLPTQRTIAANDNNRLQQVVAAAGPQLDDGLVERYIVIAADEEAAVRLPKKVYDFVRCENALDVAGCWERLTSLRRQAAAPSLMATADFAGLLEIIRNVETNK